MTARECSCARCHPATLTGIEKEGLRDLVEKFRVLGAKDQLDPDEWVTVPTDDGGVRIQVKGVEQVIEDIIANSRGDVDAA